MKENQEYTWDNMNSSDKNIEISPKHNHILPTRPGKGRGKFFTRSFIKRFITPAVVFLIITIILSAIIFILSMESGVPKFSLPKLVELTPKNVPSIKEIYQLEKGVAITSVSFSPDGRYLAVDRVDNILHIWSTEDYHLIYTFQTESTCRDCVVFSPDSHFVAAVREGHPYDVILWDIGTGKSFWESIGTLVNNTEKVTSLEFSPDGNLLVGAIANRVLFWKVESTGCELVREIVGHTDLIRSLAFSPDGLQLLTTSNDKTAKVWDVDTGNWLMTLSGHTDFVTKGVYSPDGRWIATAGYDRTIKIWDRQSGVLEKSLTDHTSPVVSLTFSPNGQLLASGSIDEQVILWDGLTWKSLRSMKENIDELIPLTFSPDNKIFVTSSLGGTLKFLGVKK